MSSAQRPLGGSVGGVPTLARIGARPTPLDYTQPPQSVSQLPAKVDLNFYQGDDITFDVQVTDPADGSPYDVTSAAPMAQLRATPADPEILATFTIVIDGTSTGLLHLYLAHDDTAVLPQNGAWDLQLSVPSVITIAAGKVTVAREVTR